MPMSRVFAIVVSGAALCLGALLALVPMKDAMAQGPRRSEPMPLPRDGDAAVREELDAARRAGTREAYDLFIARHPDHPLTATAKGERERLAARR